MKLEGGLGNQLFQYALGRALSSALSTELTLDTSYYKTSPNRAYELDNFNIAARVADDDEIQRFLSPVSKIMDRFRNSYARLIIREQEEFVFDERIRALKDGHYVVGYWQNERYFKSIERTLKKELNLTQPLSKLAGTWSEKIKTVKSCSLHVRRGDYVTNKKIQRTHGNLPTAYYQKATELISKKRPGVEFFVFSDDIAWVKENLRLNVPLNFISDTEIKNTEALVLMSRCNDTIIANSTFSWWAAWLNENPLKTVIAPRQWFADASKDTSDLLPEAWVKI